MFWIILIATITICAKLWRLGGDGYDLCRNPGVPIVIALSKLLMVSLIWWSWWNLFVLLYIPALWGMIQAFSYGTSAPPHKFWVWVFGKGGDGNYPPVEIATRCTCGFFWSLPAAIFAFYHGTVGWILFGSYALFLTIMNGLIWYFIKNVEHNESMVGASVSVAMIV